MHRTILITGAAGFIGFHAARRLLAEGWSVLGVDNLNTYYDPLLKKARLAELNPHPNFRFERHDLDDRQAIADLFAAHRFSHVLNLAAQVGVRHSLVDPHAYAQSNLLGFLNVLEGCRQTGCRHLVYASSSSVYGANTRLPSQANDIADHPLSFYGATKRANELMAHAYAHLFGIRSTGLRFFTVYGPWGRPDMAIWLFTAAILDGKPIRLFNNARMRRDFTYIDDAIEAMVRLIGQPAAPDPAWRGEAPDPASSRAPWRVHNIGSGRAEALADVVALIEQTLGRTAIRELLPPQPGEVAETCADISELERVAGFRPLTPIHEGIGRFVDWFIQYRRSLGSAA